MEPVKNIESTCPYNKVSFFDKSFIDLWLQKMFRNIASVKYQFMAAFFTVTTYGMFFAKTSTGEPYISAALGLGFLGGGFITLATSRIVVNSSLIESKDPFASKDK